MNEQNAKHMLRRIKTILKSRKDHSKITELVQNRINKRKDINDIPKYHKQYTKTWTKSGPLQNRKDT